MYNEVNNWAGERPARSVVQRGVCTAWKAIGEIGKRRRLSVILVFTLVLLASAAPSLVRGWFPVPEVHDEFGYLLTADTFAHGRLTNPPHPMWESLESVYIIQQPTYQAKYPPAQGVFLAIGQVLTGLPIVGVWLSAALMCSAVCWMLQAWVPGRWALVGALLVSIQVALNGRPYPDGRLGYWSQSYWGGAVAALGGALVYGGIRRIVRRPQVGPAILFAVGIAILAASRPYEGFVLLLPAAVFFCGWFLTRSRPEMVLAAKLVVLPITGVILVAGAMLATYNHSVTGNAMVMPYMHYTSQYGVSPIFVWQHPAEIPEYRTDAMREIHVDWELTSGFIPIHGLSRFGAESLWRVVRVVQFQLGSAVALATLAMLPWIFLNRWNRLALAAVAIQLVGSSCTTYFFVHYAAPMTGVLVLVGVQGLRRWGALTLRWWPTGRLLVIALLTLSTMYVAREWIKDLTGPPRQTYAWARERSAISDRLKQSGEKHLVILRYGPNHVVHADRVFNGADIDNAPVVWAREMDDAQNERLLQYFRDRKAWLMYVDADNDPTTLVPYSPAN